MKRIKLLQLKGIASFSGYLTSMMEEMMIKGEVFCQIFSFYRKNCSRSESSYTKRQDMVVSYFKRPSFRNSEIIFIKVS
jgi:hypothetical protein